MTRIYAHQTKNQHPDEVNHDFQGDAGHRATQLAIATRMARNVPCDFGENMKLVFKESEMAAFSHPGSVLPETQPAEPVERAHAFFDEQTQLSLAKDDSTAWRSVTGILIAIVTVGLLIAIVSVAAVLAISP